MKKFNNVISLENEEVKSLSEVNRLAIVAFADEMTAMHQYRIAKHIARGKGYTDAVPEYEQHMKEEEDHAEEWLKRLEQLGVLVKFDYVQLQEAGNPWTPITTSSVPEQLQILIEAEEKAAEFYKKIAIVARDSEDFITQQIAKRHLADEIEHATDLKRILESI